MRPELSFERDLDAVAFALHRMGRSKRRQRPRLLTQKSSRAGFDGAKFAAYLTSVATGKRKITPAHDIYTIPVALGGPLATAGGKKSRK